MKTPTLDVQARAFPTAALMMQQERNSARTGPLSYSVSSSMHAAPPPALNSMPPHTQQFLLMRDLLQVLAGVEGQYIRVAAAPTPSTLSGLGAENTAADQGADSAAQRRRSEAAVVSAVRSSLTGAPTTALPKVAELHFLIDLDTADRSVANQVCSTYHTAVVYYINMHSLLLSSFYLYQIRCHSYSQYVRVRCIFGSSSRCTVVMSMGWCPMLYVLL